MENENNLQSFKPIEVSTHNLYFHEDSPIFSTDSFNRIVATCGVDNSVRFWYVNFSDMKYRDNVYKTASNSSIKLEYFMEFTEFSKPINCVRFYQDYQGSDFKFILGVCCDGGKVLVITDKGSFLVCNDASDDAYEVCWCENKLLVGFASGKIEAYDFSFTSEPDKEIIEEIAKNTDLLNTEETQKERKVLKFKLIFAQKIHSGTIQGISFNKKHNLIATHSLDKTVKVHRILDSSLDLISVFDQKIDNSRGLFKRLFFDDDMLYIFIKNCIINVISYPFKQIHLHKKIGPLNGTPVKILKCNYNSNELLCICTKKSVYIIMNDSLICTVDNCCYMAITDAFFSDNTLFVSSLDGFLSTIRLP